MSDGCGGPAVLLSDMGIWSGPRCDDAADAPSSWWIAASTDAVVVGVAAVVSIVPAGLVWYLVWNDVRQMKMLYS